MRASIFFLIIIMNAALAKADCLACWELRKVEVTLKNGETKTGFVYWNESWLFPTHKNWKEWENRFPENFMEYNRSRPGGQKFDLVTKLTIVKNDSLFEFKAITKEDQQTILTSEVLKIVEIEKGTEKYGGAGEVPIFTSEELNKLNTNPYATYQTNNSVSDSYFLSYNKQVTRQQLKKISENNKIKPGELAKMGVIVVTLGYD